MPQYSDPESTFLRLSAEAAALADLLEVIYGTSDVIERLRRLSQDLRSRTHLSSESDSCNTNSGDEARFIEEIRQDLIQYIRELHGSGKSVQILEALELAARRTEQKASQLAGIGEQLRRLGLKLADDEGAMASREEVRSLVAELVSLWGPEFERGLPTGLLDGRHR